MKENALTVFALQTRPSRLGLRIRTHDSARDFSLEKVRQNFEPSPLSHDVPRVTGGRDKAGVRGQGSGVRDQ